MLFFFFKLKQWKGGNHGISLRFIRKGDNSQQYDIMFTCDKDFKCASWSWLLTVCIGTDLRYYLFRFKKKQHRYIVKFF